MILTVFLSLLGLAAFAVLLSYLTDDEIYFPVALAILFLLGVSILTSGISYASGNTIVSNYTYVNGTAQSVSSTVSDAYTIWNDGTAHTIGWSFSIMAFIGFILNMLMIRRRKQEL